MERQQCPEHYRQNPPTEDPLSEGGLSSPFPAESKGGLPQPNSTHLPETDSPLVEESSESEEEFFQRWFDGNWHKRNRPKEQMTKQVSEGEAREFFWHYLGKKWNKRKEEKELGRTLREVNRLRRLYPGVWEEVLAKKLEKIRKTWEEKYNRPW